MPEALLEYFEKLEEHFQYHAFLDDRTLDKIVEVLKEKKVNLGSQYHPFYPSSLFLCLSTDLGSSQKEVCYELLQQYGYYYNNDIKLAIQKIQKMSLESKRIVADSLVSSGGQGYKNVQSVEMSSHYIYITDETGYTYTMIDLNNYDMQKDEFHLSRIKDVIPLGGTNDCHNYASKIAPLLPEGETITAACPRWTGDKYYLHSYTQYGDYIIDLTLNMMMPKDAYYRLMSPIELLRTRNIEVPDKKREIESMIGDLKDLGKREWAYVVYMAFLNVINNPELLDSFGPDAPRFKIK